MSKKKPIQDARKVIEKFGGIRPMASKLDIPVTTVQGWKKRNRIPGSRRQAVLEAAKEHSISLDDILSGSATSEESGNDNQEKEKASAQDGKEEAKSVKQDTGFQKAVQDADRNTTAETRARHQQAIEAAEKTISQDRKNGDERPAGGRYITSEDFMKEMSAAERRAIKKSVFASFALIFLLGAISLFLFWPSQKKTVENAQQLKAVEEEIARLKEEQSFFQRMLPQDFEQELSRLKTQAEAIQDTLSDYTDRAENLAQGVLGKEAGSLDQRLERLEAIMEDLGESGTLSNLVDRVRALQDTVQGQEQLTKAVAELKRIVSGMQNDVGTLEQELEAAQQENDALGETLEGVSQTDLKAASMLLALTQFRQSLHRNAPFEEDLALLQDLVGEDNPELNAAIERLAPQAKKGVLTPSGLSSEFKGLAGEIVVSSLKGEDVTVQDKAKARLNEVLQVEKDGELLTGTETQAKIARAQKALDEGDVATALAELKTLDGEAAQTAEPFMDKAEKTLLAQQVEEMLSQKVLSQVSGNFTNAGGDLKTLMNKLENLGHGQGVVSDEESGLAILPQEPKLPRPAIPEP